MASFSRFLDARRRIWTAACALPGDRLRVTVVTSTGDTGADDVLFDAANTVWDDARRWPGAGGAALLDAVNARVRRLAPTLAELPVLLTMGVVEIEDESLSYWGAGHPRLFTLVGDDEGGWPLESHMLTGRGNPLGLDADLELRMRSLELPRGELLRVVLRAVSAADAVGSCDMEAPQRSLATIQSYELSWSSGADQPQVLISRPAPRIP